MLFFIVDTIGTVRKIRTNGSLFNIFIRYIFFLNYIFEYRLILVKNNGIYLHEL